ncbi:MAG: DUF4271 domain-containing protein [Alistipes sp.]|nr:DUF4271 domain-containing protein [Alistipes sp.]
MKVLQSVISAEELFGSASRLVVEDAPQSLLGISSLGIGYQIAVAVIALTLIFAMVRYAEVFRHILLSMISPHSKGSDNHIFSAEIRNIEIMLGIIGVVTISLVVLRFTVLSQTRILLAPLLDLNNWSIVLVSAGALATTILLQYLLLWAVGSVGGAVALCREVWHRKMLYFSCAILLTSPPILVMLLSEGGAVIVAVYVTIAICLITTFLFLKETFLLFNSQRVSIFHWILYLCTLEILPLSLLVAPIVRGEW